MARLQEQLKYFVHNKLSTDRTWQGVKVYLSGHEVCASVCVCVCPRAHANVCVSVIYYVDVGIDVVCLKGIV